MMNLLVALLSTAMGIGMKDKCSRIREKASEPIIMPIVTLNTEVNGTKTRSTEMEILHTTMVIPLKAI